MDETAIAEIDAHMGNAAAVDAEEDQIPGPKTPAGDRFRSVVLGPGGARDVDAGLTMGVLHQAAAVETFPRRAAAVTVGRAEQIHGRGENALAIGGLADGGTLGRGTAGTQRKAGQKQDK